jgi:hypothetical protein
MRPRNWRAGPVRPAGRAVAGHAARLLVVAGLAGVAALGPALPAAAHEPGAAAADQRVRIVAITPQVPGLTVRFVEAGALLELRNDTGRPIEVLGYHNEPLLRVGPEGVVRNAAAPSWAANELPLVSPAEIPAPRWQRDRDGTVARWHDLRTDWQDDPPAQVRAAPDRVHLVREWAVPLRDGATPIEITGTIDWMPPPPALWWWSGVVLLGLVLLGLGARAGGTPVLAGAAFAVGLTALGYAVWVAAVNADPGVGGFLVAVVSQFWLLLAGIGAVAAGVAHARRRSGGDFLGAIAGAAAVMAGINAAEVFSRAMTLLPGADVWARLANVVILGGGIGLVGAGVLRLLKESQSAGEQQQQPGDRVVDHQGEQRQLGA